MKRAPGGAVRFRWERVNLEGGIDRSLEDDPGAPGGMASLCGIEPRRPIRRKYPKLLYGKYIYSPVRQPPEIAANGGYPRAQDYSLRLRWLDAQPGRGAPHRAGVAQRIQGRGSSCGARAHTGDGHGGGWHRPALHDQIAPPGPAPVSTGMTGFRCRHCRHAPPGGAGSAVDPEIRGEIRRPVHKSGIMRCWSNEERLFVAEVQGCIAQSGDQETALRASGMGRPVRDEGEGGGRCGGVARFWSGYRQPWPAPIRQPSSAAHDGALAGERELRPQPPRRTAGALNTDNPQPGRSPSRIWGSVHGSGGPTGTVPGPEVVPERVRLSARRAGIGVSAKTSIAGGQHRGCRGVGRRPGVPRQPP